MRTLTINLDQAAAMSFMAPIEANTPTEVRLRTSQIVRILCVFGLLIALRLPATWKEGRFLDEEVTVFFAYAWNFEAVDALFRPFAGYWNLAANGSTLLLAQAVKAGLISLEEAPYATMLLGLASQLLPIFLLLKGEASWLQRRSTRLVAGALVVMAPGVDEVYLNVVHIQFHLALCVGIILALDVPARSSQRWLTGMILFLAPLCGPGAILFLPLFVLRALVDRDRGRALQALVLGVAAATQLLVFYAPSSARGVPLEPVVLAAGMFVRLVLLPVGGPLAAVLVGGNAFKAEEAGNMAVLPLLAVGALVCLGLLVWWSLRRRDSAPWLVAGALLVAGVSFGLGAAGQADDSHRFALLALSGPRYNYIPLVLLSLAMLVLANRPSKVGSKVASTVLVLNLLIGALFYQIGLPNYSSGPSWTNEVAAWRADPNYQLRAWPKTVKADLSGRRHACPDLVVAPGNPADPRYCESGWLAGFYAPDVMRKGSQQ